MFRNLNSLLSESKCFFLLFCYNKGKEFVMERDYKKDNELAKEAIERENEFLKNDVIDQGADTAVSDDMENEKTDIEKSSES